MDIPIAIHVDSRGLESLGPRAGKLELQARSLRNTLGVLKRRLKGMKVDKAHTIEDVKHYKYVLDHLEEKWRDEQGTFAGSLTTLDPPLADSCSRLWNECYDTLSEMEEETLEMSDEMRSIHSHLVDIQRRLQEILERDHTSEEISDIFKELYRIDSGRIERGGLFAGDIEAPAPGHTVCMELLSHDYELARQAEASAHDEPQELRATADALRSMHNDLRKLMGQKHHTSEDISHYRFLLASIAATEGEYGKEWEGSTAEKLLEECVNMVEQLEATAEEMDPAVAIEYRELKKLKKELTAAHSTSGKPSDEEMKRWQEAVRDVDERRAAHGGVFGGQGEGGLMAPPGQIVCSHLMDDCFSLLHDLEER